MKIDYESQLFQNLNGRISLRIKYDSNGNGYIKNKIFNTFPLILHGAGSSKWVVILYYFLLY